MSFSKGLFCLLYIVSLPLFADNSIREVVKKTYSYPTIGIGISDVEFYKTTPKYGETLVEMKIVIQPLVKKEIDITEPIKTTVTVPTLGNPIWVITAEQLPVTEDQCLMAEADCEESKSNQYRGGCHQPCLAYGPKFLAFDEKKGKLYLAVSSSETGVSTGLGVYFIFTADIHKKTIQFYKDDIGPLNGSLSPNGKYLVLIGYGGFEIHDTETKKSLYSIGKTIYGDTPKTTQLHYLVNFKWTSETKFIYEDKIAHDKFQGSTDGITEYLFDVISQKETVNRIIQPYEYKKEPEESA